MYAWCFAARMVDEVARLLRAMEKHRYLKDVDHRIHFAVDRALADVPACRKHAQAFEQLQRDDPELQLGSRDPRLWRSATVDDVIEVLTRFWDSSDAADERREKLLEVLTNAGIEPTEHDPFRPEPDDVPFPELVLLDWELFAVDELDADRHAGALRAIEEADEEVDPSATLCVEATPIAVPELVFGARQGILTEDFMLWAEPPYAYADYVFRGVSKVAKLVDPPSGYNDV